MIENKPKIKPKQAKAINALLASKSNAEAAKKAGISETSLYRWLKNDAFKDALDQAEGELVGEAVRRLASLMGRSVEVFDKLLTCSNPSPADHLHLKVARTIMDTYPKHRELASLEDRLRELEEVER